MCRTTTIVATTPFWSESWHTSIGGVLTSGCWLTTGLTQLTGSGSSLPPDGVIALHGGGNIGGSWPNHQRLRRRVLGDFPDRRIVIMPQSIWVHGAEADETAADYGRHEQLTLLVS